MNKRNNTIRGVLLLVAAALMFSSCAETPGPEDFPDTAVLTNIGL